MQDRDYARVPCEENNEDSSQPHQGLHTMPARSRSMKRGDSYLFEVVDDLPMAPAPEFVVSSSKGNHSLYDAFRNISCKAAASALKSYLMQSWAAGILAEGLITRAPSRIALLALTL